MKKEGDRGKPLLELFQQEAVVNQRLQLCSEVMWSRFLSTHLRVRVLSNSREQQIPPKGFVSQLTESSISGVRSTLVVDQLRSTSLACGVMSG